MAETKVLIVGAGPTGLTLALELAAYGIRCRIIDKKPAPTSTSNAVAVQARTLELLSARGVSEKMLAAGVKMHLLKVFANGHPLATLHLQHPESNDPILLALAQSTTEAILIDALKAYGIEVQWNTALQDLNQNDTDVQATLLSPAGEEKMRADFIVGCDGYHSKVREGAKIEFKGADLKLHFLMMDGTLHWDEPEQSACLLMHPNYFMLVIPLKDSWRIIAEVSRDSRYRNIQAIDEKTFAALFAKLLKKPVDIETPKWTSQFWVHEKIAGHYQRGRLFLAGDAAHVHSPAGGQGMNTGMQDAINLAWKLALVIDGKAPPDLLASYESERRPVAQEVIRTSGRLTRLVTSRNFLIMSLRRLFFKALSVFPVFYQQFARETAELNVNYRKSPIASGEKNRMLAPGDRAPPLPFLQRKQHTILIFSEDVDLFNRLHDAYGAIADLFLINETLLDIRVYYGIDHNGMHFCVIRPDHYIGYLGRSEEEMRAYFNKIFRQSW